MKINDLCKTTPNPLFIYAGWVGWGGVGVFNKSIILLRVLQLFSMFAFASLERSII